jgi:O-antigen/teichoic acid export membrane protein
VALLGLYQQATMLVRMPIDLLGRLAGVSLFPALARGAEGGREELAGRLLRARRVILPLGVAAVVGLAFGAPPFVYVLYPGKFQEIGWMARYMSVGLWITILQLSSDRALLAIGHSKSLAMANMMNLIATITFAILGLRVGEYYRHAMPGFILGVAAGNLCGHLVVQSALAREHIWIYLQDLKYTLLLGALGAVGIFLPRMLEQMLHRPYVQFQHMPSTKSGMWLIVRMGDLFRYQPIETIVGGIIVAGACGWAIARAVRGMR